MKKLTFTLSILALTLAAVAQTPLKIARGNTEKVDTVRGKCQYIVGVTAPGARATIDGKEAHVYKTGSFGAEVTLKPGLNSYTVAAEINGETTSEEVRFFYDPQKSIEAKPEPKTTPLDKPLNITTKAGAYLQYGNGDDRLGGSKIGYLQPFIPLTAIAETDNLYQVMLGESQWAYLPKEYALEGGDGFGICNSGSASFTNIGKADRLSINLPKRVPYSSYTMLEPSTIVVKLYGVTNNTNWLTQRSATEMIDYVDLRQESSDILAFYIHLKEKYQWGYTIAYDGHRLTVDVKHKPASLKLKDLTIGLDAGHGGAYLGAVSPSGLQEKEVNLDITLKLAEMLRREGATVVLTRTDDSGPSMTERKRIWTDANVDVAISIHNNASGNPLISMGTSCYYKHLAYRPFAQALYDSMLDMGLADFGLTGNFNFSLNTPTEYPNALVEVLFMSSLPDEEVLADPARRAALAKQILKGLKSYLKEAKQ